MIFSKPFLLKLKIERSIKLSSVLLVNTHTHTIFNSYFCFCHVEHRSEAKSKRVLTPRVLHCKSHRLELHNIFRIINWSERAHRQHSTAPHFSVKSTAPSPASIERARASSCAARCRDCEKIIDANKNVIHLFLRLCAGAGESFM